MEASISLMPLVTLRITSALWHGRLKIASCCLLLTHATIWANSARQSTFRCQVPYLQRSWRRRQSREARKDELSCIPFRKLLPHSEGTAPFYGLAEGLHDDIARAEDTLEKLQAFDAAENVLVIIAHDWSLLQVVDLFPKDINQWKQNHWGELARWRFLADFREAISVD